MTDTREEITIGDRIYRIGAIPAKQQLHIVRRIGPVIAALTGEGDLLARALGTLSQMSDADTDYILDHCLEVCVRQRAGGKGWAPLYRNGQPMFDDLDLSTMLQLTRAVLEANLGGFFTGSSAVSAA